MATGEIRSVPTHPQRQFLAIRIAPVNGYGEVGAREAGAVGGGAVGPGQLGRSGRAGFCVGRWEGECGRAQGEEGVEHGAFR